MSIVVNAFLTAALAEIRVARAGDVVGPDDMDLALTIFNEYLDALNAEDRALYTTQFVTNALTPSLQPHTIGVTADAPTWAVTVARPVEIIRADLLISATVRQPITIRDNAWWLNVRVPTISSSIPTDLMYSADWPNGSIYFWPVPSTALSVLLEVNTLLAQVALTDTMTLPPGYQQMARLDVSMLMAPAFGQQVSAETRAAANEARARVWGNNIAIPTLVTRDGGMPGGQSGGFDFRSGQTT